VYWTHDSERPAQGCQLVASRTNDRLRITRLECQAALLCQQKTNTVYLSLPACP